MAGTDDASPSPRPPLHQMYPYEVGTVSDEIYNAEKRAVLVTQLVKGSDYEGVTATGLTIAVRDGDSLLRPAGAPSCLLGQRRLHSTQEKPGSRRVGPLRIRRRRAPGGRAARAQREGPGHDAHGGEDVRERHEHGQARDDWAVSLCVQLEPGARLPASPAPRFPLHGRSDSKIPRRSRENHDAQACRPC